MNSGWRGTEVDHDSADNKVVRGTCHHDCPDTCVWDVHVRDGRAVRLRGNAEHPTTRGELCPKVNRFLDRVYHPDRILKPLRRCGPKGSGEFAPIDWDDAIAEIAARFGDVIDRHSGQAILQYSFDGTQGLIQKGVMADRFFDAVGASDIHRHLCGVTASMGAADVYGQPFGIDPEEMVHSRTIILWGTNTKLTNRHLWPTIEEARNRGATVVVVDPVRTATADAADRYIRIRPGTDVALVLAMVHVLDRDGLIDRHWVEERSSGWEELSVAAKEMRPERAALITGIDADTIEWLADLYGRQRPAAIRMLVGPEHREQGREIMAAVAMLPAVTGAWADRGGGLARSTEIWFEAALGLTDRTRPARRKFNMAALGAVLTGKRIARGEAHIAALMVHNSNPAVICPDQNTVMKGLSRPDLFCVVAEQFMTDTARYADIILPSTTQIEHLDLGIAWGHLHLALNRPAIAPVGEALSNTEMFRRLAAAMKLDDPRLRDTDEDLVRQLLDSDHEWMNGIGYESLNEHTWQRLSVPEGHRPQFDARVGTDDGLIHLGPLEYCPGSETPDGDPELARRFPLILMSRKQHTKFLNANYGGFARHLPTGGRPTLAIDPVDADARGIRDGDLVRVHNDRGSLTVAAELSEILQPGLVTMPFGWWHRSTPEDRGVNALTNPRSVDGTGSAAFHENLVEVLPTVSVTDSADLADARTDESGRAQASR